LLFYGAFLPQFVTPNQPIEAQIALLSATFFTLAVLLDGAGAARRQGRGPSWLPAAVSATASRARCS